MKEQRVPAQQRADLYEKSGIRTDPVYDPGRILHFLSVHHLYHSISRGVCLCLYDRARAHTDGEYQSKRSIYGGGLTRKCGAGCI